MVKKIRLVVFTQALAQGDVIEYIKKEHVVLDTKTNGNFTEVLLSDVDGNRTTIKLANDEQVDVIGRIKPKKPFGARLQAVTGWKGT